MSDTIMVNINIKNHSKDNDNEICDKIIDASNGKICAYIDYIEREEGNIYAVRVPSGTVMNIFTSHDGNVNHLIWNENAASSFIPEAARKQMSEYLIGSKIENQFVVE